jgi:hypothetical protein
VATGPSEPDLTAASPGGELKPGQGVDRDGVRLGQRGDVAHDDVDVARLEKPAGALAEPPHVGGVDGTTDHHLHSIPLGRRSRRPSM